MKRHEVVKQLYKDGLTQIQIAAKLNTTRQNVFSLLNHNPTINADKHEKKLQAYKVSSSVKEMAKKLDLSHQAVRYWLNKNDLDVRYK